MTTQPTDGLVPYFDLDPPVPGERSGRRHDVRTTALEMADDFLRVGVMSAEEHAEIRTLCLTPVKDLLPGDIRALRRRERITQAFLAQILNVTTSSVSQWERGEKRPSGAALRMLSLIDQKGLGSVM